MKDVGDLDAEISAQVRVSRAEMRVLRAQTRHTHQRVAAATRVIAVRTAQTLELQNTLLARQSGLVAAKRAQSAALESVQHAHEGYEKEAADLEARQRAAREPDRDGAGVHCAGAVARFLGRAVGRRVRLAGLRPGGQRVRLALGTDARGHRHRRGERDVRSSPSPPAP